MSKKILIHLIIPISFLVLASFALASPHSEAHSVDAACNKQTPKTSSLRQCCEVAWWCRVRHQQIMKKYGINPSSRPHLHYLHLRCNEHQHYCQTRFHGSCSAEKNKWGKVKKAVKKIKKQAQRVERGLRRGLDKLKIRKIVCKRLIKQYPQVKAAYLFVKAAKSRNVLKSYHECVKMSQLSGSTASAVTKVGSYFKLMSIAPAQQVAIEAAFRVVGSCACKEAYNKW